MVPEVLRNGLAKQFGFDGHTTTGLLRLNSGERKLDLNVVGNFRHGSVELESRQITETNIQTQSNDFAVLRGRLGGLRRWRRSRIGCDWIDSGHQRQLRFE